MLKFALKFLKSVIAFEVHLGGYFAAITVWHFSDDLPHDWLVPNLFVRCGSAQGLEENLSLREVTTTFGKRIRKLVPKLKLGDQFSVLEDTETEPGATRLFIAPTVQPYQGFVNLDHFRSALNCK